MPPVTRLAGCASRVRQGTASRAPGYAVPNASGVAASTTEEATSVSVARGARSSVACRRALPSVRATQQPSGVNACGIQHNRALFAAAPVVRYALLVGQLRIMGGYVLRPCRLPCVPRCRTHSTASQCARAGKSDRHQHMRLVTRCARGKPDSPFRHHRKNLPPLPRSG